LVVAGGMALFGAISYVFIMGNVEKDPIAPPLRNRRGSESAVSGTQVTEPRA
jgi:hypothetical protein